MKLQILVSTMDQTDDRLIKKMNISGDALIVNQCSCFSQSVKQLDCGAMVKWYNFAEKGVGLSRNSALMRAEGDILLFADDDVIYKEGYEHLILSEFQNFPKADVVLFNVPSLNPKRPEYQIHKASRVHFFNCLRYGTFRIAVRKEAVLKKRICFSSLFGGGSLYGSGEDSLFLMDCIKNGLKVYASPKEIGVVQHTCSSWFEGYTEKFFFDKGALFACMAGPFAVLMCVQFCARHREFFGQIPVCQALEYMLKGIKEFRNHA